MIDLGAKICHCCKGDLHRIGEDKSERLDMEPAQFRIVVTRRPKYARRACEEGVLQKMRRVRDVIRMKAAGLPSREIARRMDAAPSTVRLTIRRFEAAGLSWPLPDELTDAALEARLFAKTGNGNTGQRQGHRRSPSPTGRRCTASSSAST